MTHLLQGFCLKTLGVRGETKREDPLSSRLSSHRGQEKHSESVEKRGGEAAPEGNGQVER